MSTTQAERSGSTARIALIVSVPVAIVMALLTLFPTPIETALPGFVYGTLEWLRTDLGLTWMSHGVAERIANTAMFVPVGAIAVVLLPRGLRILTPVVAPVLATLIELAQAIFLPTRYPSVWDVVAAAIGGLIGIAIGALILAVTNRRTRKG